MDPVTALLAAEQGFSALHLSGAVVSATRLGLPDLGYVHGSHTEEQLAAVGLPQVLNRSQAGTIRPLSDATLTALDVRLVIHPVAALLAMTAAARATYAALRSTGTADGVPLLEWAE